MAYMSMKKLIVNENKKYENAAITVEEYNLWKENTQNKLDVFFACNRLTQSQYEELCGMLIDIVSDTVTDQEGDIK